MSVQIAPLRESDVKEAAALHQVAFPGFFLSELGEPFLRQFYRAFLGDHAVALVARADSGALLGAVLGTTRPGGFFRRLLIRRWYAFAWASLGLVARRPSVIPRLLRALTYRGQTPLDLEGALLSSICVAPDAQGLGLGRRLIDAWTDRVVQGSVHSAYLTTDAIGNVETNDFYSRAGWTLQASYQTVEGRYMNCYTWHDDPV